MKPPSFALPLFLYGDPADNVDLMRKLRKAAEKFAERDRLRKSRRHKRQVKQAKLGKGKK